MPLPASFCPYVGLQPYTEEERDYFFGRERDQRVIASNLYASSMTILYGTSGVGKSSVLMAGVVPMLRRKARTAVVVYRDWQRPDFLAALKRECLESVFAATKKNLTASADSPLDELLHSIGEACGVTILLLLDQFEEYFLYHPESEMDNSFDSEFARAVNRDDVDAGFLLALREEGLSKLDRFRARIPNLMGNLLRLRHLDAAAAEEAIRKPLAVYNERLGKEASAVTVEDDLVRSIIDQVRSGSVSISASAGAGQPQEVEDDTRIETPFLQLVLTRLWEEECGADSGTLRLATLERLGGAGQIVRTHLDEVMAKLKPREQSVCAGFFDRLVTPSGSKIACRLDDLREWAGDLADQVPPVLQVLSDSRILRTVSASPGQPGMSPSYEIFHDVLAPAILDWRRRFIELRELGKIREEEKEKSKRRMKRRTIISVIAVVLALVLGCLASSAFYLQRAATFARRVAEQRLQSINNSTRLLIAALSEDPLKRIQALASSASDLFSEAIKFNATEEKLPQHPGNSTYRVFPVIASIPGGIKAIASITYIMKHPSFKNQVYPTGPDNNFTVSYEGYGTVDVIAIIEYANPKAVPTFAKFHMEDVMVSDTNAPQQAK